MFKPITLASAISGSLYGGYYMKKEVKNDLILISFGSAIGAGCGIIWPVSIPIFISAIIIKKYD